MLDQRDAQLKKERGYHGKSFVRPDGSEVLLDKRDWDKRKRELWARAGGRCEFVNGVMEYKGKVIGEFDCQEEGQIPAHIIPRAVRRDDRLEALKLYCLPHDRLMEKQAWRKPRFGEGSKSIQKRLGGKA